MPWSSRSRILDSQRITRQAAHAFVYQPVALGGQTGGGAPAAGGALPRPDPNWALTEATALLRASIPKYTEEDLQIRERGAREKGFGEAEARLRADYEKQLADERDGLLRVMKEFQSDRESYFERAEAQVVALSLAIARKILHREAQIDPLLLAGLVRLALEKVSTGGPVRLRVPPAAVGRWREILDGQVDLRPQPEVVGDGALNGAQCVLETEVGSAELSVETQLEEIEKGFLDLLATRPG